MKTKTKNQQNSGQQWCKCKVFKKNTTHKSDNILYSSYCQQIS